MERLCKRHVSSIEESKTTHLERTKYPWCKTDSTKYMAWFRSVTTQQFVSEPRYLMDPYQHASSSYAPQQFTTQHQCEPTQTQQPTIQHQPTTYTQQPNTQHRNPFMPTTQQPTIQRRNPFIPLTQTQNQESNPATTTVYSPDDSYGSLHRSPPSITPNHCLTIVAPETIALFPK